MAPQKQRTPFWVTFIVVSVGVASFALMQSMTVPVLPRIETEMHTDQTTVTWVLTAYLLSASVFTPIVGRVGDAVGKERMLVFSLSMLCVGSVIRGAVDEHRRPDRRPRRAGHRRRRAAVVVRDHPRRVPASQGRQRGELRVVADGGRVRCRHRARRSDRGRPRLSLAVLAAGDRDRSRRTGNPAVRARIAGAHTRTGSGVCRRC